MTERPSRTVSRLTWLWQRLTDPSLAVPPLERQQVAFLSALILLLSAVNIVVALINIIYVPSHFIFSSRIVQVVFTIGSVGLYILSRTRFHKVSAALLVLLAIIGVFGIALAAGRDYHGLSMTLTYLAADIIVAGMLFTPRSILLAAVFCLGGVLCLSRVLFIPESRYYIEPIRFLGVITPLVILFGYYRERVEAERRRQLMESEQHYRLLAENATDIILRNAVDGTILYVSPACREALGYEPEEMTGKQAQSYFHPDDLDESGKYNQRALLADSVYKLTHRLRHKDGHYIWFEILSRPMQYPESGKTLEIYTTSRDISERLRAVEMVKASRAEFALVLMDFQMPVIDGNAAAQHIHEWEAQIGQTHLPIVAMTANVLDGEEHLCYEAGMDDFVAKPFGMKKLKEKLTRWIQLDPSSVGNDLSFD